MIYVVEYHDPSNVYQSLAQDLKQHLPLRDLNWTSETRPLRSIPSLHVDFVEDAATASQRTSYPSSRDGSDEGHPPLNAEAAGVRTLKGDDAIGYAVEQHKQRRHQIPGLRQTPYLKVYFLQCSDVESYKLTHRKLLKDWVKDNAQAGKGKASPNKQENHNAWEWLIIVISTASTNHQSSQGRSASRSESRWSSKGSKGLAEKIRSDFNGSSKNAVDRVGQIEILETTSEHTRPSAVPLQPDAKKHWEDLTYKLKSLILASFDLRVSQYEEDIKEKDSQRNLPGWNFNTFFLLKEGLALGFESVGLLEDALNSYHELAAGLNEVIGDQQAEDLDAPTPSHFRGFSQDLQKEVRKLNADELLDGKTAILNTDNVDMGASIFDTSVKPYRDLILANDISLFDFQCYIFARQMSLLFRIANVLLHLPARNALSKDEDKQRRHSTRAPISHSRRFSQSRPEDTRILAEICRRTLGFVGSGALSMRDELYAAKAYEKNVKSEFNLGATDFSAIDNLVQSWVFSACQSILDAALPADLHAQLQPLTKNFRAKSPAETHEESSRSNGVLASPTRTYPDRISSLSSRSPGKRPPSPEKFPSVTELDALRLLPPSAAHNRSQSLAASRADLLALQRQVLSDMAFKRAKWTWGRSQFTKSGGNVSDSRLISNLEAAAGEESSGEMNDIAGVCNNALHIALSNEGSFRQAYEVNSRPSLGKRQLLIETRT